MTQEDIMISREELKEKLREKRIFELISYKEVFEHSELIVMDAFPDNPVFDRYCVNPECDCSHVGLEFMEMEGNNFNTKFFIYLDYASLEVLNTDNISQTDAQEYVKKLSSGLIDKLKKRRAILREAVHDEMQEKLMVENRKKRRKLGRNEPCHCGSEKKYKHCCLESDIKKTGSPMKIADDFMEEDGFWSDGSFVEGVSDEEMKLKERTIHMGHDEEMNFKCEKCNGVISAHNKDWHDGMCDKCFNETHIGD